MLCPKCGVSNPDDSTNCTACGSPLTETEVPAAAAETPAVEAEAPVAEAEAPAVERDAPKKRKSLPWILAAAGAAAVLIALLIGGAFGGNVHSDPETVAFAFLEEYYALHYDKMCETIYPNIVDSEFEADFRQALAEMEEYDFSVSGYTVMNRRVCGSAECAEWTEQFNDLYDADIEITQLQHLNIAYAFSGTTADGAYEDAPACMVIAVAEIGGKWYVVNGYEYPDNVYGYDTPEEAALVFYEAYAESDYATMSSSYYPDIDNDDTRSFFDEITKLREETEDCVYSNFAVTGKELRGSEDIELWTQRLKEQYDCDAAISTLYYVEVSYDYVGTYDGEYYDETIASPLPVAEIDGIWYVIDGAVW